MDDEVFKKRVLKAIERPKKSGVIRIINSGFFLWLLTLLVVTAGGTYLTSYQQCRKDAADEIEKNTKVQRELFQREVKIREIIFNSTSVVEMNSKLGQPYSYYPEFAGVPTPSLREILAAFLARVADLKFPVGQPLPRPEIIALYSISQGAIPPTSPTRIFR